MELTTMTQPKKRVWAIDFNLRSDGLYVDFISIITGEVITGITYSFETEKYSYIPPFSYEDLYVYIDGESALPMTTFLNHIITLISLKTIISLGIEESEDLLGWDLDKPRTSEDYMNIAVKYETYKTVIFLGIDVIRQAVKNKTFNYENLDSNQFKTFFDLVADWDREYDDERNIPF